MTNILLISEDYIKTNSGLNNNVWGEYLTPAIREAQDIKLQQIIGSNLYKTIMDYVENGTIKNEENVNYKSLIDNYIQIYLMYQTISDLVPIIGIKLTNLGIVVSNEEHVTNLSQSERDMVQSYYEQRADFYGRRLQKFLLDNKQSFKELDECACNSIKANLSSAASTGLFLGNIRGKRL